MGKHEKMQEALSEETHKLLRKLEREAKRLKEENDQLHQANRHERRRADEADNKLFEVGQKLDRLESTNMELASKIKQMEARETGRGLTDLELQVLVNLVTAPQPIDVEMGPIHPVYGPLGSRSRSAKESPLVINARIALYNELVRRGILPPDGR